MGVLVYFPLLTWKSLVLLFLPISYWHTSCLFSVLSFYCYCKCSLLFHCMFHLVLDTDECYSYQYFTLLSLSLIFYCLWYFFVDFKFSSFLFNFLNWGNAIHSLTLDSVYNVWCLYISRNDHHRKSSNIWQHMYLQNFIPLVMRTFKICLINFRMCNTVLLTVMATVSGLLSQTQLSACARRTRTHTHTHTLTSCHGVLDLLRTYSIAGSLYLLTLFTHCTHPSLWQPPIGSLSACCF